LKNDGRKQLWFNLDKSSKVKFLKDRVTACFAAVNKKCFSFLLGFFSIVLLWK